MTKILKGTILRDKIKEYLKNKVNFLQAKYKKVPGLAVILVGDDPASSVYVRSKEKTCKEIGFLSEVIKMDKNIKEETLLNKIKELNEKNEINGILVQLPLPDHINADKIISCIDPLKDVDGFHPLNVGNLLIGRDTFIPCTPYGIMQILKYYNIETEGKYAVIIGRSNIVGKPMAALLVQKNKYANATVTICHSRTKNIEEYTKKADILIAAIGKPQYVKKDMIKKGAVVIDVGINRIKDPSKSKGYRLVGDVDFENVKPIASAITPVPGGVGPMTIAMLMMNTYKAFCIQNNIEFEDYE